MDTNTKNHPRARLKTVEADSIFEAKNGLKFEATFGLKLLKNGSVKGKFWSQNWLQKSAHFSSAELRTQISLFQFPGCAKCTIKRLCFLIHWVSNTSLLATDLPISARYFLPLLHFELYIGTKMQNKHTLCDWGGALVGLQNCRPFWSEKRHQQSSHQSSNSHTHNQKWHLRNHSSAPPLKFPVRKIPKTGCETKWFRLCNNKMWRSAMLLHFPSPT